MRSATQRGLFFSLLLALTLPVVSCDSGGSNGNSTPDWRGNWEVLSVDGEGLNNPDFRMFYAIGEDKIEEIDSFSEGSCNVQVWNVTDKSGNELDIERGDGKERKIRLDTSGETLIWTVVESEGDDTPYENTASSVESDPRDILNCR